MKIVELGPKLDTLTAKVDKIIVEVTNGQTNADVPPEVEAKLTTLEGRVQALDDLNADAEPPPPPAA